MHTQQKAFFSQKRSLREDAHAARGFFCMFRFSCFSSFFVFRFFVFRVFVFRFPPFVFRCSFLLERNPILLKQNSVLLKQNGILLDHNAVFPEQNGVLLRTMESCYSRMQDAISGKSRTMVESLIAWLLYNQNPSRSKMAQPYRLIIWM